MQQPYLGTTGPHLLRFSELFFETINTLVSRKIHFPPFVLVLSKQEIAKPISASLMNHTPLPRCKKSEKIY